MKMAMIMMVMVVMVMVILIVVMTLAPLATLTPEVFSFEFMFMHVTMIVASRFAHLTVVRLTSLTVRSRATVRHCRGLGGGVLIQPIGHVRWCHRRFDRSGCNGGRIGRKSGAEYWPGIGYFSLCFVCTRMMGGYNEFRSVP